MMCYKEYYLKMQQNKIKMYLQLDMITLLINVDDHLLLKFSCETLCFLLLVNWANQTVF